MPVNDLSLHDLGGTLYDIEDWNSEIVLTAVVEHVLDYLTLSVSSRAAGLARLDFHKSLHAAMRR
jgi:hypothetical protein